MASQLDLYLLAGWSITCAVHAFWAHIVQVKVFTDTEGQAKHSH